MARRAVEQELSRERILEAARHLFITKGYRAISMRSIGQHLGYSHGSLYYHFKEKAELFYAIVAQDFKHVACLMQQVMITPPSEGFTKVEQLMLEFIAFGLDHPHQYEMMFMIRDEELLSYCRAEQERCIKLFSTMVRQFMNTDRLTDLEMQAIPLTLFLGMNGFISYYIHDRVSFEDVRDAAITHVKILCQNV
ncbi:TetR/AcrR family transcriptional regulator [Paenibacillus sediminis]|uniref:AcrR family transcriptional regulator n=1 Tax=Paenibacillus sediminis TaxID=664909 RepID=A0ABS4H5U2_9BACL|nr:TetR/AcrR family transcriptional regulator [Paenibacillus sediminis]MBP1937450.1 AcrR family transcriptional regulator [Paenibacillus sediminis]